MNKDRLDKLVAYRAGLSLDNADDKANIQAVRAEILLDISDRYPWSFLKRKNESISLSQNDTNKTLPADFLRMLGVAVYGSDSVPYPVRSEKESSFEEDNPDEDDTDRPYLYWIEYDSTTGKPKVVFRPKCDASYTLRIRFQKKLMPDQVSLIPRGLVAFFGIMSILGKPDDLNDWDARYNLGIQQMWASDMPDLNDEPDLKQDRAIERYNQDMWNLLA